MSQPFSRWSWRMATIAGIAIHVDATFLLLIVWFAAAFWFDVRDPVRVAAGVALLLLLFTCVLLHELGHALTAQRFGFRTREITLLPIGGIARLDRMPDDPRQSLLIALAGPAVNIAIAVALYAALRATGAWQPLTRVTLTSGHLLERLTLMNLSLAAFNMLPAFPMDGGRVLRALLSTRLDERRATEIAARCGQAMAIVFAVIGWRQNPVLLLIALFVWMGATQEAAAAGLRAALRGIPVARVMLTTFRSLTPDEPLAAAIELAQHEGQRDFPVTRDGALVGLLTHQRLVEALAARGPNARVADAMDRDFRIADPGEMIDVVIGELGMRQLSTAPVVKDGWLVGLLSIDAVAEYLNLQNALGRAA